MKLAEVMSTTRETLISLVKRKQWDEVIRICPEASREEFLHRERSHFNRNALSLCLALKPPLEVIQAFVSNDHLVEALQMRDSYCDYLPIHCAVRYRCSSGIVELLIRYGGTEMLEVRDRNMMTPLSIACNFGLSSKVVNVLVEGNPKVLGIEEKNGKTPLMLACSCSLTKTKTFKILLSHHESSSAIFPPNHARTRLRSCGEWTPLHLAVLHHGSLEIIQMLCAVYPETCYQKTVTSRQTPLGLYRSVKGTNADIIELLLNPMSRKVNKADYPGVIHQVLSFPQFIPGLLEFCIKNFPSHAQLCDKYGRLPLHVSIQKCQGTEGGVLGVIKCKYDELTESFESLNIDVDVRSHCQNAFPIGIALNKIKAWKLILQCYPSAIRFQDENKIYPFMLAASYSRTDIAFELLRSAPDVVCYN